ncbi:hypothetical protein CsatA_002982 [Cannabis sativa]
MLSIVAPLSNVIIPSLPNELALNILARIPTKYYAVLLVVSKSIRSAICSSQLFAERICLNLTKQLLYFKISSPYLDSTKWLAISDQNPIGKKKRPLQAVELRSNQPKCKVVAHVVVDHNIYVIGGISYDDLGNKHCSNDGPNTQTSYAVADTFVANNKIYVVGGSYENQFKQPLMEVLDPVVGYWKKINFFDHLELIGRSKFTLDVSNDKRRECVVDGVTYRPILEGGTTQLIGKIEWYDKSESEWKLLLGDVMKWEKRYAMRIKLVNLKERLVAIWVERCFFDESIFEVWCGEIEVSKNVDENGHLLGKMLYKFCLLEKGHPPSNLHRIFFDNSLFFTAEISVTI